MGISNHKLDFSMGIPHGHPKPSFLKTETHQHALPSENQPPSEFASVQSQAGSEVAVFWTCWLMWQLYRGRYQVFFFPFSAPYNIFFFFFGCIGFLLLHAGFLQVWCTSFPLRGLPLWNMGSRACGLSQPKACGISSDQDSNSCPLHWQEDSQPLAHQGSP